MINLFGVKIFLFLIVVTIVWGVLVKATLNMTDKKKLAEWLVTGTRPWWYLALGYLILIDLVGLLYIATYFLFFR